MSLAAAWAQALLDPQQTIPPEVCVRAGADVAHRFAVHRNNVMVSLVDALGLSFPVVQALVGEDFFRATAREFVRQCPPRSAVLVDFGEQFPSFLEAFAPAAAIAYLADVARLEWLRQCALYAADASPMRDADLHALAAQPDRLAQHRWCVHPSVGVLHSAHPVVSIWAAHQHADEASAERAMAAMDWQPESALVLRSADGWSADVVPVSLAQARLIEALCAGAVLPQAVHAALWVDPQFDLPPTLALLLAHGVWVAESSSAQEPE